MKEPLFYQISIYLFLSSIFLFLPTKVHAKNQIYHSQYRQDYSLNKYVFKDKRGGVFVEIGAYDGDKYSNTKFFEDNLDWTGMCIEPIPEYFEKLKENRPKSICINGCISDKEGKALFHQIRSKTFCVEMLSGLQDKYIPIHFERAKREMEEDGGNFEEIWVDCFLLNDLLKLYNFQKIDYLSIDTEGGELDILKSIDFDTFDIFVISVENNYRDPMFKDYLEQFGYELIDGTFDEIYIKNSMSCTFSVIQ